MNVCPECFSDRGLGRRIQQVRPRRSVADCDFHPRKGVPIEVVAEIVDPVFRSLYVGQGDDGNPWMENRGDTLLEALLDLTGAELDQVGNALIAALFARDHYRPQRGEGPMYDNDLLYTWQGDGQGHHWKSWADFRRSLMFDRRFFNPDAEGWLNSLFKGVQSQRNRQGEGPCYMVNPGDPQARFFRARRADSWAEAERIRHSLARELGPPPESLRRAGRLNPAGIPAFYAAFDLDTCVAELRPSVGGSVAAAQFEITKPIFVLDMTRFVEEPGRPNLFAARALERRRQWAFMSSFMEEIARPVSPDQEHLEYLPTQAVAEFLNKRFTVAFADERRAVDAIIFRSAQHPEGKNIALLGDAAVVGETEGEVRPKPDLGHSVDAWLDLELDLAKPDRRARIVPHADTFIWVSVDGAQFAVTPQDID